MNSLYANALNEMEKLWKRQRTKGFLLLTLLVPVISAMLLIFLEQNAVFRGLGSNLPMLMLGLFTFTFLPLFLFMTAVDSFSGEAAAGTSKLVLVRPITRTKVFTSKVLVIAIYIVVYLGVLWMASVISGWFVAGADVGGGLLDSIKAYAATFLPMMAIGLIAVLLAQCFNNTSGAITLIVSIYGAAKLLPFVFPQVSVLSVFSYTNWYVLWVGDGASIEKLFNTLVLLLAYCIIAYTAGWMLFDRKQW
ncbi:ABC transporter permease [Brevibacillus humidisoli]|uniref:ABC transporter permease n=1 Tax=Brevibacillus humidisoli TaxID=2895522 RepID=UPI001E2ECB2D|nr:ABC transporter permease [Brevibacillus humidisoli]UFJ39416.1 ABC transporter permease [Brevibacillus humidisoli]